jgi:hypothetical protein
MLIGEDERVKQLDVPLFETAGDGEIFLLLRR